MASRVQLDEMASRAHEALRGYEFVAAAVVAAILAAIIALCGGDVRSAAARAHADPIFEGMAARIPAPAPSSASEAAYQSELAKSYREIAHEALVKERYQLAAFFTKYAQLVALRGPRDRLPLKRVVDARHRADAQSWLDLINGLLERDLLVHRPKAAARAHAAFDCFVSASSAAGGEKMRNFCVRKLRIALAGARLTGDQRKLHAPTAAREGLFPRFEPVGRWTKRPAPWRPAPEPPRPTTDDVSSIPEKSDEDGAAGIETGTTPPAVRLASFTSSPSTTWRREERKTVRPTPPVRRKARRRRRGARPPRGKPHFRVYFGRNSADLDMDDFLVLVRTIRLAERKAKTNERIVIWVVGHAYARGGRRKNRRLALRRARKARDFLRKMRLEIPSSHARSRIMIKTTSMGDRKPAVRRRGRARNRRVELFVRVARDA